MHMQKHLEVGRDEAQVSYPLKFPRYRSVVVDCPRVSPYDFEVLVNHLCNFAVLATDAV